MRSTDDPGRNPILERLVWSALAMFGLPSIFLLLMSNFGGQPANVRLYTTCLAAAAALATVAPLAPMMPRGRRFLGRIHPREPLVPLLVSGGSLLLASSLLWNQSFRAYCLGGGTGRITRQVMANYRSPFYGVTREPAYLWAGVAAALAVALLIYLARDWRMQSQRGGSSAGWVWVVVFFQLAFTAVIALSEDGTRLFSNFASYAGFASDARHFDGALDVLRRYVDTMPQLSGFGRHYPPGIALLIGLGTSLGVPTLAKLALMTIPALTILPLLGLARELGLDERAAQMSAVLFATSASVLAFSSLSPTTVLLMPATTAVWMLIRGLSRDPLWAGAWLGLSVAVLTLLSFAAYLIALPLGCILLAAWIGGRITFLRVGVLLGTSLSVFFASYALLQLSTGYDLYACLQEAFRLWWVLYENPWEYLLRCSGSLLAYAWAIGFPMSVLAAAALRGVSTGNGAPELLRLFTRAVMIGLLLGGFSGRIYLEGERILLVFTPLIAIPAGWELARWHRRENDWTAIRVVGAALACACAYGLFVRQHFWTPL